jgi:hypothetical protein
MPREAEIAQLSIRVNPEQTDAFASRCLDHLSGIGVAQVGFRHGDPLRRKTTRELDAHRGANVIRLR